MAGARLAALVAAVLGWQVLVASTAVDVSSAGGAARAPVLVPITVDGGPGTGLGARPRIDVQVGQSKPLAMLLDTGSVGLHVFAPALRTGPGSGVTLTTRPDVISFASGSVMTGVVAYATVGIGTASTAHQVAFGLVEQASCIASKPRCPMADGIAGAVRGGQSGILGIGMGSSARGVLNPIPDLPGALGRSWSIHLEGRAGTLVLGAGAPDHVSVAVSVHLPSQGRAGGPTGHALWRDKAVPLCVQVARERTCTRGVFDTGATSMQLRGTGFARFPTGPGRHIPAGSAVSIAAGPGQAPFWRFTAGTTPSLDSVHLAPATTTFVNAGVQSFFAFTVRFDAATGTITLTRA